jgi:K+-sensing histidine kinase KdpD
MEFLGMAQEKLRHRLFLISVYVRVAAVTVLAVLRMMLGIKFTRVRPEENRSSFEMGFYLAALSTTALAILIALTADFLPFVIKALCFAAGVCWTSLRAGLGPGLVALILATLATDYFVVEPLFELSLDLSTLATLASYGALAMAVVRYAPRFSGRQEPPVHPHH